jgi:hypothetical protein
MVNAFWLDRDVEQAARWLVDAHVTSSVFECSMVLTTAAQLVGLERDEDLYFTHADHPLTQWAAESFANWQRLYAYTDAAHEEWRYRWDHADDERHGCWAVVQSLDLETVRGLDWPSEGASDPPQVTGDWEAADYVDAYRSYYANDKRHLLAYAKDREAPPWLDEYVVESSEATR